MTATEHYSVVSRLKANNKIPVTKYRSLRTGLTVTVAQVDGPVVNGYFCLATEVTLPTDNSITNTFPQTFQALDDDGLPHTLEHLVFLGSEEYPYKEVLDLLANRALADRWALDNVS